MAVPFERKLPESYQRQISRNNKLTEQLAQNLPLYQKGLFSPREFLRTLVQDFGEAQAFVITPDATGQYPLSNTLIVRRLASEAGQKIEIHDPFFSPDYPSIELTANDDALYPSKIYKHPRLNEAQPKLITENEGPDYEDGIGVANWFEISRVLD